MEISKKASNDDSKDDQDEVPQLIEWLDKNERQLIRWRDTFYHLGWLLLVMIAIVVAIPGVLIFTNATDLERLVASLSIVAVLLAFLSMVTQISERNVVEARLKHALRMKNFTETQKPLLKALIKIKSKNPESRLATLYILDRDARGDVFTKRSLLKTLCQ